MQSASVRLDFLVVTAANEAQAQGYHAQLEQRRRTGQLASATTALAVVDPGSRKPTDTIDAATVRAPTCMVADALTKIVMISGTDATEVLEHYNASALLISTDGDVHITPDWHHAVHLAA